MLRRLVLMLLHALGQLTSNLRKLASILFQGGLKELISVKHYTTLLYNGPINLILVILVSLSLVVSVETNTLFI